MNGNTRSPRHPAAGIRQPATPAAGLVSPPDLAAGLPFREEKPSIPPAALKELDPVAFSAAAEEAMTAILDELLAAADAVPVSTAVAEVAYRLNVSVATARRYILKWTAPSAPYALVGKTITRRRR